ncbi:MAG: hemerythrin [Desulfocapsa sp.]|nr:MAG: hemerythrin [Desulfocapsa sp.]
MPLIKWRDSFSVGVQRFDDEHKVLLNIINEMFVIVRDQKSVEHLVIEINKLIQYTQEHFTEEEAAMAEVGYPALEKHKEIHKNLLKDVTVFKKRVDEGDEQAITTFYHFLRDWLLTHIIEEDMKYKPFLADEEKLAAAV